MTSRTRLWLMVLMAGMLVLPLLKAPQSDALLASAKIVILGGPNAVSDAVAGHLATCSDQPVERISGENRYATAAEISKATYPGGATEVFVATGSNFPDAVAAGSPAALAGAPVLLTGQASLPAATSDEITRLGATTIHILGGEGAVSSSVETALGGFGTVDRLYGPNRHATAAAISQDQFPAADTVYVATGSNFPDALAGGPVAAIDSAPILLVTKDSIPSATQAELDRLAPSTTYVLGGEAVISNSVASSLPGTVIRLAGANRYATAAEISSAMFAPLSVSTIYVATGLNFPDALAGAAAAGAVGGPVLLVGQSSVPSETAAEIARLTELPCDPFAGNTAFPTCDFTPFTLTGFGDSVPSVSAVGDHPAFINATYSAGSNFVIWSLDDSLTDVDLLVNEIGSYEGRRPINHYPTESGVVYLDVTASGAWQIDVLPFCAMRQMSGSFISAPATTS